jgi:C1A family cysteine protease
MFHLNLIESPADARDYFIKVSGASKGVVDLSQYCTSIKNQGTIGSCTAFAVVGAMELIFRKMGVNMSDDIFSELFNYYVSRVMILQWPNEDTGAYLRDAIKAIAKYGCCLEKSWPYNEKMFRNKPSEEGFVEALKYQAVKYYHMPDGDLESIKKCLDMGLPVVGGFWCYSNLWNTGADGVVPLSNGKFIGGHAVLFVGYDDEKKLLKFKNSWSELWGRGGYGYLHYEYVADDVIDLWTLVSVENRDVVVSLEEVRKNVSEEEKKVADRKVRVLEVMDKVRKIIEIGDSGNEFNQLILGENDVGIKSWLLVTRECL